jgi:hypothetical protein
MWHATGAELSISKCDKKIEYCTTLAAITKLQREKSVQRLEKILNATKKKLLRMHFQRVSSC